MPKSVKPGQPVTESGIYRKPGGGEVTLVEGKPAPPTPKPGEKFVLDRPTKHKK